VSDPVFSYGAVAPFPVERFLTFVSHLKVQSKDMGLVPFRLLGTQRYILDELARGLNDGISTYYILKARQIGCTTFFIAVDLFWSFDNKGLLGTFILHKEEARDDWRQSIEVFYDEIPQKAHIEGRRVRFKPSILRHNRNILSFANGSRFRYLIAGTAENRRGGLGRSGASNYVHGTEVAFYGNEDDIRAFKSSTSAIYAHRLQIWESTANGFNHFYEAYEAGKEAPGVRVMFIGWWRDERNQFPVGHALYEAYCSDNSVTKFERTRIRAVKGVYGFDITMPQLAWYRWKMTEDFSGDEQMMLQEFPWTDEDAFQATGSKYFAGENLTAAIKAARAVPFQGYRYKLGMRWEETSVQGYKDHRAELRIWEHSSRFGHYVIGCDPAYGSSDTADRTVISVWRAYAECICQVAEFCTNQISTYQCAWVLAHLAGFYGQADCRVILEITGPGTAVWQELQQLRSRVNEIRPKDADADLRNVFKHMREFMFRKPDSLSGELAWHWKMTDDLKRSLMAKFKDAFELQRLIPRSVPLLEEMRHIINDEGHIEAEGAHKDDRVIAAALAHEAWRMWSLPILKAKGMTVARAKQIESAGGEQPIDRLMLDYLKRQQIKNDEPARIRQPWEG
jgi:hypothetical protein